MTAISKKKLRSLFREKRQSLTLAQQQNLSAPINHTLLQSLEFKESKKIAVYLAQEHEVDLTWVIQEAWAADKTIYLPVISKNKAHLMRFCMYRSDDALTPNKVNILEPNCTADSEIHPSELDLVLLPLVAFDLFGHRLGRGGGYYDAAFHFCQFNPPKKMPTLIGVAYEFQKADKIEISAQDVNLHKVVTEKKVYEFRA